MVLLRIKFRPRTDEVAGAERSCKRKSFISVIFRKYCRGDQIKENEWAGHVARMGKTEKLYTILVGKPAEKRLLREPKRRCEDNIKMNIRYIGFGVLDYILHNMNRWRDLVNTLRAFWVQKILKIF
jgi:hypothetical protein